MSCLTDPFCSDAVSIETELKLQISAEHLSKLKRHPFVRSLTSGRARTLKLTSIYYDTPDLSLSRHAMALRLRNVGKQWIQTLKGGGKVSAGLHQRNEFEAPVPSEQLDFEVLKDSGGKLPHGVRHHLRPIFITDFSRNIRLVEYEGAQIELCMDSGEIRAGNSIHPISEVELELKSGEPAKLFKLALELIDIFTMKLEHTSKAEYGYRLFSSSQPSALKGKFSHLRQDQTIQEAMRSLISDCISHIQTNVPGALRNLDCEYLHQIRVGLRRLRVVISITLRFKPDAELSALSQQVSELCVRLGSLRDWDVFINQTLRPLCIRIPEHKGLQEFLRVSEKAQQKQHAGIEELLGSVDFQRILLRFGAWMHTKQVDEKYASLKIFLSKALKKRLKDVAKCEEALRAGGVNRLHELRIACKKLRYCIEMFESLIHRKKSRAYLLVLGDLQDVLGRFNDKTVAHRLVKSLDSRTRQEAIALIHAELDRDVALNVNYLKALNRLTELKPCWD